MSRSGFALVEALVGLALAALVALLAHAGVSTWLDVEARAARARQAALREAGIRRQLVDWIAAATLEGAAGGADFEAVSRAAEGLEPDDRLRLLTLAPSPFAAERRWITLRIERGGVAPGMVAVLYAGRPAPLTPDSAGPAEPVQPPDSQVVLLLPHATGMLVRLLYPAGGTHLWTSAWRSPAQLPEAVELRVLGDSVPPLLRLPVYVLPRGRR